MARSLGEIRESTRAELEDWLAEAEKELTGLRQREGELEDEVELARTWLGEAGGVLMGLSQGRIRSLQDAMTFVLGLNGRDGMKAPELAAEIAKLGLYRMRDGRPVDAHQIHARVNNYPELFVRLGGRIFKREDD